MNKINEELAFLYQNVDKICNDCDTFTFMRRTGIELRRICNLGNGVKVQGIALFSALSILSKIHYILEKGTGYKERLKMYYDLETNLKSNNINIKKYKSVIRKPKVNEINETDAFVLLVNKYNSDIGLKDLTDKEIRLIWNDTRNDLIHNGKNNPRFRLLDSIQTNYVGITSFNEQDFTEFIEMKNDLNCKGLSFRIKKESSKESNKNLLDNLVKNNVEYKRITDLLYIKNSSIIDLDSLTIDVRSIKSWLINYIEENDFLDSNLEDLNEWLLSIKKTFEIAIL